MTNYDRYRRALDDGATQAEVLRRMGEDRLGPLEATRLVRALFQVGLGDAKRIILSHPVWEKSDPFRDEDIDGLLTHLDSDGRPRMVDTSAKEDTARTAVAAGRVTMSRAAFDALKTGGGPKGNAIAVAEIAGVMAAKHTSQLIPLCHPLPLTSVRVAIEPSDDAPAFEVRAEARVTGKTGVEMEALTAVSVACLTLYDMAKALDKGIVISDVRLLTKTGGKSGDYRRSDNDAGEDEYGT